MIITQEIAMFREAVRHLWNTYLRIETDWDGVANFRDVCRLVFAEQLVSRLGINGPPIPVDQEGEYIPAYRIITQRKGRLPLLVNRELPPSGYWDHAVNWIDAEEAYDIRPISFYDFDVLGWRLLEYYRVRVIECPSHLDIVGRDALIRCDHVNLDADTI